jgi:hypothetical protein
VKIRDPKSPLSGTWGVTVVLLFGLSISPPLAGQDPAAAAAAYLTGDWATAAALYAEVVTADSANARDNYRIGFALLRLDPPDLARAVRALDRATRISGGRPVVAYETARAHAGAGSRDTALALLRAAVAGGYSAGDPSSDPLFASLSDLPEFDAIARSARLISNPCGEIEEHGQFDFWLGEWVVRDSIGNQLGTNSITREDRICALFEDWTAGAFRGMSINYYDPLEAQWEQHWATPGSIMELRGGIVDGSMRMHGLSKPFTGTPIAMRGTWTPLADGRVRQVFEQSSDGGLTWVMTFEGFYERVPEESAPDGR